MTIIFIAFVLNELFKTKQLFRFLLFLIAGPTLLIVYYQPLANHINHFYKPLEFFFIPEVRDQYAAVKFLKTESQTPKNIAYTGMNWHYFFYGDKLKNQVYYININNCQDCRYYEFRKDKNSIRREPNFQEWLKNLRAKNIQYLVTDIYYPNPNVKIYETSWAEQYPYLFKKIWEKGSVKIFKLKPRKRDLSKFLEELQKNGKL